MANTRSTGEIRLTKHSDAYWRVTIDLPPLNIFGPANIPQLEAIVSKLETDDRVRVVVFDSAVEGFFLTHYDFLAKAEESAKFPVGRTGLQALPDMLVRLSRAPVVSIASIRGRATGVGSELALASDMRFASREKSLLSQWEVGAGLVPGVGPMARLPRLIGLSRALDLILTGRPVLAPEALAIGLANRVVPRGTARQAAEALAAELAALPQPCLRSDRESAYESEGTELGSALQREFALGMRTIATAGIDEGASRFVGGAGRGGKAV